MRPVHLPSVTASSFLSSASVKGRRSGSSGALRSASSLTALAGLSSLSPSDTACLNAERRIFRSVFAVEAERFVAVLSRSAVMSRLWT